MQRTVKALLAEHGITLAAPISLQHLTVTRPYLLARHGIDNGTAFMLAVPYYTTYCDDPARNISIYACARDYHRFFEALFADVLPRLRAAFPENRFAGFADHSPISEPEAAVKAGLGQFGCNHLFLTKEHSSFVFLGEIITDAVLDAPPHPVTVCSACGACRRACPVGLEVEKCLSAVTQKKGLLTAKEAAAVLAGGSAWGCDVCQLACPITQAAKKAGTLYSKIPFFNEQTIPRLTYDRIAAMSEEDFAARAYGWRGRAVILRNLALLESTGKGEPL